MPLQNFTLRGIMLITEVLAAWLAAASPLLQFTYGSRPAQEPGWLAGRMLVWSHRHLQVLWQEKLEIRS